MPPKKKFTLKPGSGEKPKPKFKLKPGSGQKPKKVVKPSKRFQKFPEFIRNIYIKSRGEGNIPLHGNATDKERDEIRAAKAKMIYKKGDTFEGKGKTIDQDDFTRANKYKRGDTFKITGVGKKFLSLVNAKGEKKKQALRFTEDLEQLHETYWW